jgi:hypothetical protein
MKVTSESRLVMVMDDLDGIKSEERHRWMRRLAEVFMAYPELTDYDPHSIMSHVQRCFLGQDTHVATM